MQVPGHVVKWIWAAVIFAYLIVQLFAWRRLKGDKRRRSRTISRAMLILIAVEDTINSVLYRSRVGTYVGVLITGVAAIIATAVLVRMFGESPVVTEESEQGEHELQSLNLN